MSLVLFVDDDAQIRRLGRIILEAEGHEVLEAPSGRAALDLIDRRPDAIFCDVSMPDMTGPEFLLKVRLHPHLGQTPATFVTAHSDRIARLAWAGIAEPAMIRKPF